MILVPPVRNDRVVFLYPKEIAPAQQREVRGMDLKVVKRYVDRYTKEVVEPGTVLKNVSQERAAEL